MTENVLKDSEGKPLYYWNAVDNGIRFEFDYLKFASGGCLVPSLNPPDCRCSGCGFDGYRDQISDFFGADYLYG